LSIDSERDFSVIEQLMTKVDPNLVTWQELAAELGFVQGAGVLAG